MVTLLKVNLQILAPDPEKNFELNETVLFKHYETGREGVGRVKNREVKRKENGGNFDRYIKKNLQRGNYLQI